MKQTKKTNWWWLRTLVATIMAIGMTIMPCIARIMDTYTAYAAETKTIRTVRVSVGNTKKSYPKVSTSDKRYTIESSQWDKREEDLKAGDIIEGTIVLKAKEGYEFDVEKATVKGAELVDEEQKDGNQYILTIEWMVGGRMEKPEGVCWDPDEPWFAVAEPNDVEYVEYTFTLYWRNKQIGDSVKTEEPMYDFSYKLARLYGANDVKFKVSVDYPWNEGIKASKVAISDNFDQWEELREYCYWNNIWMDSYWNYDDSYNNSNDLPNIPNGGVSVSPGYWVGQDGEWYYIKRDGTKKTGWLQDGERWYFLDVNGGKAFTGWREIEGQMYYFYRENGISENGYSYKECELARNMWIREPNGNRHKVDDRGRKVATEWCN